MLRDLYPPLPNPHLLSSSGAAATAMTVSSEVPTKPSRPTTAISTEAPSFIKDCSETMAVVGK
ncbi:MAG: hypothetical protein V5B31_10430 [Candidatus Accumulibacter propinquus]|uniref:hypothetical protein n=1 Tax=Candidatus Accumulibacter propinquus TaxID=2954380 RepID=UPI002FC27FB2